VVKIATFAKSGNVVPQSLSDPGTTPAQLRGQPYTALRDCVQLPAWQNAQKKLRFTPVFLGTLPGRAGDMRHIAKHTADNEKTDLYTLPFDTSISFGAT